MTLCAPMSSSGRIGSWQRLCAPKARAPPHKKTAALPGSWIRYRFIGFNNGHVETTGCYT